MSAQNYARVKIKWKFTFYVAFTRTGLTFGDILPENAKSYDKMRPPKKDGQATTVFFHVTVMGLDSIDETSMVRLVVGSKVGMTPV